MKNSPFPSYIKTKVIMEFGNGEQAKAFFNMFNAAIDETSDGIALMTNYLPKRINVNKVEKTKELKHNYLVKIV